MESQSIDAAEFRARQRESWNIGARGWREWSEYIDRGTAPVSRRLVELAGIRPGSRVLDVAAGYGEPSLTAAGVAGPEGRAVATDISPQTLALGPDRAPAAGRPDVSLLEDDPAPT